MSSLGDKRRSYEIAIDEIFNSTTVDNQSETRTYEEPDSDPGLAARGFKRRFNVTENYHVYKDKLIGHINVKAVCQNCNEKFEYGFYETLESSETRVSSRFPQIRSTKEFQSSDYFGDVDKTKKDFASRIIPRAEKCPRCKHLNRWIDKEKVFDLARKAIFLSAIMVLPSIIGVAILFGTTVENLEGVLLAAVQLRCIIPWLLALAGFMLLVYFSKSTRILYPSSSKIKPVVFIMIGTIIVSTLFGSSVEQRLYYAFIPALLGSLLLVFGGYY